MQQRVEIVKILATDANLLIFDEPTAVLAGSEVAELFEVLRKLRCDGTAVVLIAHKLAEILAVADRITVLRHGERIATTLRSETDARTLAGWMVGDNSQFRVPSSELLVASSEFLVPSSEFQVIGVEGGDRPASDRHVPEPMYSQEKGLAEQGPTPDGRPPTPNFGGDGLAGQGPAPETLNQNLETRKSELGIRNSELGSRNCELGTRNSELGTGLSAERVSVRGDRGELAIREVSFDVHPGEIFGIGGVDGNGQAELAESLAGLRQPASGQITWSGAPFDPAVSPATGYIPQDRRTHGIAITMSIEENLILDAVRERRYRYGPLLRRRALRELASDLVRRYDIRIPGLRFPAVSLSGGNQQKIVVARALRGEPDWIVAMNPTRGLDLAATRFVREQLIAAKQRGAAVLLISTDLDELAAIADRNSIMSAGRLTPIQLEGIATDELGLALGGVATGAVPDPAQPEAKP
jgi:ABC-type uncharacterized transport system ATPase subunit